MEVDGWVGRELCFIVVTQYNINFISFDKLNWGLSKPVTFTPLHSPERHDIIKRRERMRMYSLPGSSNGSSLVPEHLVPDPEHNQQLQ